MAFQLLREQICDLMREATRAGTPAGLKIVVDCRSLPIKVNWGIFAKTLKQTIPLTEEVEDLLHSFLDPFNTGVVSWRDFIKWIRQHTADEGNPQKLEARVNKTIHISTRVCAALRKKLALTSDGDYNFETTFERIKMFATPASAKSRHQQHFISYSDMIQYVRRCIKLSAGEARLLLSRLDGDADGAISLKDFTGFMLRHLQIAY